MIQLIKKNLYYTLPAFAFTLFSIIPIEAGRKIIILNNLNPGHEQVKSLRKDIRKSIFIVKSFRSTKELPNLRFSKYRIKKTDTFWSILARTSQNIDTLMTVNSYSAPGEAEPGKTIYIPNMRGVLYAVKAGEKLSDIAKKFEINEKYITAVNKISGDYIPPHIFIPCAQVSNLERSLFLGTGFRNPISHGRLTSGFGIRKDPFNRKYQFHKGVDISCRTGTPIHSARNGKVLYTGYKGSYGLMVMVKHAHDYYSCYGHLSRILVRKGQMIKTGTVLGLSGNTGRSTGPHLHFEVRKGKRAVNPGILWK